MTGAFRDDGAEVLRVLPPIELSADVSAYRLHRSGGEFGTEVYLLEVRDDGVYLAGTHRGRHPRPVLVAPVEVRDGMIWEAFTDDTTEPTFRGVARRRTDGVTWDLRIERLEIPSGDYRDGFVLELGIWPGRGFAPTAATRQLVLPHAETAPPFYWPKGTLRALNDGRAFVTGTVIERLTGVRRVIVGGEKIQIGFFGVKADQTTDGTWRLKRARGCADFDGFWFHDAEACVEAPSLWIDDDGERHALPADPLGAPLGRACVGEGRDKYCFPVGLRAGYRDPKTDAWMGLRFGSPDFELVTLDYDPLQPEGPAPERVTPLPGLALPFLWDVDRFWAAPTLASLPWIYTEREYGGAVRFSVPSHGRMTTALLADGQITESRYLGFQPGEVHSLAFPGGHRHYATSPEGLVYRLERGRFVPVVRVVPRDGEWLAAVFENQGRLYALTQGGFRGWSEDLTDPFTDEFRPKERIEPILGEVYVHEIEELPEVSLRDGDASLPGFRVMAVPSGDDVVVCWPEELGSLSAEARDAVTLDGASPRVVLDRSPAETCATVVRAGPAPAGGATVELALPALGQTTVYVARVAEARGFGVLPELPMTAFPTQVDEPMISAPLAEGGYVSNRVRYGPGGGLPLAIAPAELEPDEVLPDRRGGGLWFRPPSCPDALPCLGRFDGRTTIVSLAPADPAESRPPGLLRWSARVFGGGVLTENATIGVDGRYRILPAAALRRGERRAVPEAVLADGSVCGDVFGDEGVVDRYCIEDGVERRLADLEPSLVAPGEIVALTGDGGLVELPPDFGPKNPSLRIWSARRMAARPFSLAARLPSEAHLQHAAIVLAADGTAYLLLLVYPEGAVLPGKGSVHLYSLGLDGPREHPVELGALLEGAPRSLHAIADRRAFLFFHPDGRFVRRPR